MFFCDRDLCQAYLALVYPTSPFFFLACTLPLNGRALALRRTHVWMDAGLMLCVLDSYFMSGRCHRGKGCLFMHDHEARQKARLEAGDSADGTPSAKPTKAEQTAK